MSAQPGLPPPELVNIEVDGRPVAVAKGSMIIHATDSIGVPVPRFCYHKKLPIAANCRMCLVEVEKSPKPMPACATPVMEGMKVFTRSDKALKSQRNVMEFLLINHPLDCPICDQGGECELQDVAMGYGRSVSRFVERKRVVADEDIGPLIATDMTRCIHCTRCVRFMTEIAGTTELGGLGRGEHLEIGTYIGKSIESELGGNIIDVCPVGALTNKVFRYKARPWELIARPSLGYHDALHSNLYLHARRGEVLRCVPRENEAVNESWLSDRDRWSHQGLAAPDRVSAPMLRENGAWREVDWQVALERVADILRDAPLGQTGVLAGPGTSCEEGALLARLGRHLGTPHLDHRLGQSDFADDGTAAAVAGFELPLAAIERARAVVLVGCEPQRDAPLLNHRIRKAWRAGASVYAINPLDVSFNVELAGKAIATPSALPARLAALVAAALELSGGSAPAALAALVGAARPDDGDRAAAKALVDAGDQAVVIVGEHGNRAGNASRLRALARLLARSTGAACNVLPAGSNGVGLARAGLLPGEGGDHAAAMIAKPHPAYVLYNAELLDFAAPAAAARALGQGRTIAFTAFADARLREVAEVIVPIGLLPEIDATLVNVDGLVQQTAAGGRLPGSAQPGWRALRALAELLAAKGFDFTDLDGLRAGLVLQTPAAADRVAVCGDDNGGTGSERIASLPIYRCDAVVRRSPALQATPLGVAAGLRLSSAEAARLGLVDGGRARIAGGDAGIDLPVLLDDAVPAGAVRVDAGFDATAALPAHGRLTITGVPA
jgi:NADH-quinone oxidoreductase subunit G